MDLKGFINPRFVRRQQRAQRAAWLLMLAFLLLAAAGFLGGGALVGEATARAPVAGGEVAVEYATHARQESPQTLRVRVDAPGAGGRAVTVALSPGLAEAVTVSSTTPPAEGAAGAAGAAFQWRVDSWSGPLAFTLRFQAEEWGRVGGVVTVTAGDQPPRALEVAQWVAP